MEAVNSLRTNPSFERRFQLKMPQDKLRRNLGSRNLKRINHLKDPGLFDSSPKRQNSSDTKIDIKEILSENTNKFCNQTTLHGLKYVVDNHLYPFERIFFALSFVAVVGVAAFFISNVYEKWKSTPVIVGLSPEYSFVENEPFPGVTICNLNQASKRKVSSFGRSTNEFTMLKLLCKRDMDVNISDTIDWSILEEFIVNISQPCSEMIVQCHFGGIEYNCSEIFRPIVTDEGLCCVFNMVSPDFIYKNKVPKVRNITYTDGYKPVNWDPEKGYPTDLPEKYYPRQAIGYGETLGLSLTLDADINDYFCSSTSSIGFKMALHSPIEKPHVRETGTLLAPGMETKIRIRTDKTEAARNLKSMNRHDRKCLFEGEEELTYFNYYNRRNCEMECKAREFLKHCGCITFYMPIIDPNARICGIKDGACVNDVRRYKLSNQRHKQQSIAKDKDCQRLCWPSCFDLTFFTDFFSAPISNKGFNISSDFLKKTSSEYAEKSMTIAHFYFQDNTFRTTRQTEFIGITDFLSSVGGLMGLFMGFSFISIAEFIYYAILRPYHLLRRHDRLFQTANYSSARSTLLVTSPSIITPSRFLTDLPQYKIQTQKGPTQNSKLSRSDNNKYLLTTRNLKNTLIENYPYQ